MDKSKINVIESKDAQAVPKRVAVFPKKISARFKNEGADEKLVMTFPNLIMREMICFQTVVIVTALLAIFFNAPLEELANPRHTPNPAKAPWYFLGLQEMLHSFPPLVAGVLLPGLVVVALIVIPYFKANVKGQGQREKNKRRTFYLTSVIVFTIAAGNIFFQAYSISIPTLLIYCLIVIPYFFKQEKGWVNWLRRRSLSEWIMTWFVVLSIVLTLIGTFFRGPGWSWIWPWQ